ncbi:MAG: DUF4465 domain-containing protein [Thermodesulfobacteriota bacterium]
MRRITFVFLMLFTLLAAASASAWTVDFEDLTLASESYRHDTNGFTSQGASFYNYFYAPWNYWEGWSYSNRTDTTVPMDYTNQWSSMAGGGYGGIGNYGVAYDASASYMGSKPLVCLDAPSSLAGAYFTNNTYAYSTMFYGDWMTEAFEYGDWFRLSITGYKDLSPTGVVEFYLADYRSSDQNAWYIVDAWTWVDLSALGVVDSLSFSLSGSDSGAYGLNTPAYFALDNLTSAAPVPIPGAVWLFGSGLLGLIGLRRKRGLV